MLRRHSRRFVKSSLVGGRAQALDPLREERVDDELLAAFRLELGPRGEPLQRFLRRRLGQRRGARARPSGMESRRRRGPRASSSAPRCRARATAPRTRAGAPRARPRARRSQSSSAGGSTSLDLLPETMCEQHRPLGVVLRRREQRVQRLPDVALALAKPLGDVLRDVLVAQAAEANAARPSRRAAPPCARTAASSARARSPRRRTRRRRPGTGCGF